MFRFLKRRKNTSKKILKSDPRLNSDLIGVNRGKRRKRKNEPMVLEEAPDIYSELEKLVVGLNFNHILIERIRVFRSRGSKAYARARIWAFPRIWQKALSLPAHYIIEVLSERFDHLSYEDKQRVLIHELMHIPKNFSGSLVSHRGRFHSIDHRTVEKLFNIYKRNCNN